jgi:hypothetical protein
LINFSMFVLGKHDPILRVDGQWQRRLINVKAMAEAGFWVAWDLPTLGGFILIPGRSTRSASWTPGSATASPRRPTCTSKRSGRPAYKITTRATVVGLGTLVPFAVSIPCVRFNDAYRKPTGVEPVGGTAWEPQPVAVGSGLAVATETASPVQQLTSLGLAAAVNPIPPRPAFPTPVQQLSLSTNFVDCVTGNYLPNNTSQRFSVWGIDVGVMWDNRIADDPDTPFNEHQVLLAVETRSAGRT